MLRGLDRFKFDQSLDLKHPNKASDIYSEHGVTIDGVNSALGWFTLTTFVELNLLSIKLRFETTSSSES